MPYAGLRNWVKFVSHTTSERLAYDCLDDKYKQKHRAENARKQKKHQSTENLAAAVPLKDGNIDRQEKEVVIDTFGNETVEPQTSIIRGTDYDDNVEKVIPQQSIQKGLTECEDCEIRESRIKQLEDALRNTTKLIPADQIAADRDDKIKQLQRELLDKTSENVELSDELKHLKEVQADVNVNSPVNVVNFEFSLPYQVVQPYMAAEFQRGKNNVWFGVKINVNAKKVISAKVGRTAESNITN